MQIIQEGAVIPEWTLGDRLRKAREHAGLSQTELGHEIGVSLSSISRYEIDRYPVPKAVLMAWAICTNCDHGWLLGQGLTNSHYFGQPIAGFAGCDDCPWATSCAAAERCAKQRDGLLVSDHVRPGCPCPHCARIGCTLCTCHEETPDQDLDMVAAGRLGLAA